MTGRLFSLGQTVWTPAAAALLARHTVDPLELLERHARGDWGDVAEEDRYANDLAVEAGFFILSAYRLRTDCVWVVTEPSYETTTIMLPEEY